MAEIKLDPAALRAAVAAQFPAQTAWLQDLVRFDTTRGKEAACQDWIAGELAARGYAVDRYTIADVDIAGLPGYSPVVDADYTKAVQVVATHEVEKPEGRSLILQGHIDVVPVGAPELWSQDPFDPRIVDGWMTGRGSGDMKAGVSAMVFALDALRSLGFEPAARVHIQTVSEEECTGNGALSTLARGYRADAAFIPESNGHTFIRAELGSVWFRLRILGQPGHALGKPGPGAHAIWAAQDYMHALQALTDEINEEAKAHRYFGAIEGPVKFNPGKIHGGDWLGSVPSWCELECRISVLPGISLPEMRARVIKAVEDCAARLGTAVPALEWHGFQSDGHVFEPGTEAEAVLAQVHECVLGTALQPYVMCATSDTRFYDLYYDIPALCYGGIARGLHSPDEAVDLDSLQKTTETIARFIAEWCGLRRIG